MSSTETLSRSFTLTSGPSSSLPAVIDLTSDSPSPSDFPLAGQLPQPTPRTRDDLPPAKRRRVESPVSRDFKECLKAQVIPYLNKELKKLPELGYDKKKIGSGALVDLVGDKSFVKRVHTSRGFLKPEYEAEIGARVRISVNRLARLPDNQTLQSIPRTSLSIPSVTPSARRNPLPTFLVPFVTPSKLPALPPIAVKPRQVQPTHFRFNGLSRCTTPSATLEASPRPYRTTKELDLIALGAKHPTHGSFDINLGKDPAVYHVDFTEDEVTDLLTVVLRTKPDLKGLSLQALCDGYPVGEIIGDQLPGRSQDDIRNVCTDITSGHFPISQLRVLSLSVETDRKEHEKSKRSGRITNLLFAREMKGNAGFGGMRSYVNFQNDFQIACEDELQRVAEFTNCAGDMTTISWVSDNNLLCGTTAHSDSRHQQYNKPGNLLFYSAEEGSLRALPDHRIPRPLVNEGENATAEMRRSQDPWLYTSVVSSDFDQESNRAYTSSFDRTVKVWKMNETGCKMEFVATWPHDGNVNFVAAAKDGSGRVASAADVSQQAVRVYTVKPDDVAQSTFQAFSCSRSDADGSQVWAYYPATMQWGKSVGAQHLLAVGYSPRSFSGDEKHIPDDKLASGEIVLWDAKEGHRVPVLTATTANVFEVLWHPKLPRFIAATSPSTTTKVEGGIRTQIHVFRRDKDRKDGAYSEYQTLDCTATDINELTFMPNSYDYAYITAACTDGRIYVWDTALGDTPVHILHHKSAATFEIDEAEASGAKFSIWGTTLDRFYTGGNDGIVNVWNVRHRTNPHVRVLMEAPGAITAGAFSPNMEKLAIGDATGRLHILSVDERDEAPSHYTKLPGSTMASIRRPQPFIPHPEPLPPAVDDPDAMSDDGDSLFDEPSDADYARRTYLDTEQLKYSGDPFIGVVQGPAYAATNLFCLELHEGMNPLNPLLPKAESQQRESIARSRGLRRRGHSRLRQITNQSDPRLHQMHQRNNEWEIEVQKLPQEEIKDLVKLGAVLSLDDTQWDFKLEEVPKELK